MAIKKGTWWEYGILLPEIMRTLRRKIWQRALWWRFRLFQRHRHERLVLEKVAGRPLVVLPGVMNPALFRTGAVLAQYLEKHPVATGTPVLELGTGSGLLAVVAAEQGAEVVAVDINPEAVRCARINALLNRVETRVDVRHGDLFGPLAADERFELVLFNPPFFGGEPAGGFDLALRSGNIARRFAGGLAARLVPGGQALVILSSLGEEAKFVQAFRDTGLEPTIAERRDTINEILTIYRVA